MKLFIAILISCLTISVSSKSQVPDCGCNANWNSCGSNCRAPTCANLYSDSIIDCPTDDCDKGCFCNEGFAINADNVCVDVAECAPKIECGRNEILSDCASPCGEPSCINPTNAGIICPAVCITACVCKRGYIRDRKGVCIRKSDCPRKKCEKNEFFSTCGNVCHEPSCEKRVGTVCMDCQVGCYCKKGYARDITGKCIRESKCPRNRCNKTSEEYKCRVGQCEPVCGKEVDEICTRARIQCEMGCYCKDGYILDSKNGKCIPLNDCHCRD